VRFFARVTDGLGRERAAGHKAHLHGLARQEAECPVIVPLGGWATGKRNEMRQLLARERLPSALLPLVVEHRLQPARAVPLARVVDRPHPHL
jgi:hypothetical protein